MSKILLSYGPLLFQAMGQTLLLALYGLLFACVIGMIVGIPVFAVIYYYAGRALNYKLKKKGYSTDLNDYRVDPYRVKPKKKKKSRRKKAKEQNDNDVSDDNR